MGLPIFIGGEESDEIIPDIRNYLKEKGAELSEETSQDGVAVVLEVIRCVDVVFKSEDSLEEVEKVLHCIVSLTPMFPEEPRKQLIQLLCEKLGQHDAFSAAKLKALNSQFHGLEERDPQRYQVYLAMVQLAGRADLLPVLKPSLEQIKKLIKTWGVSVAQYQALLRALHAGLAATTAALDIKAATVMIELLGTFTEETAAQAREDAHKCVVSNIADPHTYVMDHLLSLKPVRFLEGEPIHDLLTIFCSGKLAQYMQFHAAHAELLATHNLSHEACMAKMRVLTLMSIAELQPEMSLPQLQNEMHLEDDDVETFIIDVVRTQMVLARLDQVGGKVYLTATTTRTFGKSQWMELRSRLISWQQNLGAVLTSFESLVHLATPPLTAES